MPGAFPTLASPESARSTTINESTTSILNKQQLDLFSKNHQINQKTKHQHHLLSQFETTAYILVGYQFIKYCHSACLFPVVAHVALQHALNHDLVNLTNGMDQLNVFFWNRELSTQERAQTMAVLRSTLWLVICWKAVLTILWHTLFVCQWLVPLVDSGALHELEHDSWFVSFIGEQVPHIDKNDSIWLKMAQLGLIQLVMSDIIILFIQLVCFQCIFLQSTAMLLGDRSLGEEEAYIIRPVSDQGRHRTGDMFDTEVPCILKVKLYESFKQEELVIEATGEANRG
ncbi:uncharacterized protein CANTADRAFT_56019 [Suhomyces tanzawaensis NRRL Y-17324]|uniref:Uncharacterized protein n=1 Tax=Suhomyces tanzawaensis NRRL Y-17324 TaxID=984487 RepID=A0A1E4SDL5_9ASCO|nr:uncharacterized protein CANTADRAFT_56019 [Suhomyces tanzawaensis NRRL Y-17324]ODV77607.1 hypothetical protein CANTADRAFT_56019 [Suhomyces tanzawaensis NRRL Y-17324]